MHPTHLDIILKSTGGGLFVFIPDLARLTGWSAKTLRNAPEKFPLKIQKMGNRVGVPAILLANYLDRLAGLEGQESTASTEMASTSPRRRGRPPKADRVREGGA